MCVKPKLVEVTTRLSWREGSQGASDQGGSCSPLCEPTAGKGDVGAESLGAWLMLGDKYELPITTPSFSGLHVFTWMITAPSSESAS